MKPNDAKRRKTVDSSDDDSDDSCDNVLVDLSAENKKLLGYFEKKVSKLLNEFKQQLEGKDLLISNLEQKVSTLTKKVMVLEDKVEDNEAFERRDTLIISGSNLPVVSEGEDCSSLVRKLFKDKVNVNLKPTDISLAHRVGKKPVTQAPDKRSFMVKLCKRELKSDLLQSCRTVKPQNIFVNESLTQTRSTALFGLRQAKRKFPNLISGCGSREGKVIAWVKPPKSKTPLAKNNKVSVNTREKFDDFCSKFLKCSPSDFALNWP